MIAWYCVLSGYDTYQNWLNWNGHGSIAISIVMCRFVLLIITKGYILNRKSHHITVCVVSLLLSCIYRVTDFIDFYKVGSSFLKVTLLIYGIWKMHLKEGFHI